MRSVRYTLLLLVTATSALDEVTQLPGWPGQLPSKWFSGYIPVGGGARQLHYTLTESESRPAQDPLVLWLNGGPGSSSLKGAFTEIGQLVFSARSLTQNTSEVPRLWRNPWAWTREASVVYLESPAGVGFSYCTYSPCLANDTSTADDSHEFLLGLLERFPQFKSVDFFITGESYAGIYIPMLMDRIRRHNKIRNFRGAAIGNGCYGNQVGTCAFGPDQKRIVSDFYFGHGLFPVWLKKQLDAACGDWSQISPGCEAVFNQLNAAVGPHNFYNLEDFCSTADASHADRWSSLGAAKPFDGLPVAKEAADSQEGPLGQTQHWCNAGVAQAAWEAIPAVAAALNVKPGTAGMNYTRVGGGDMRPLYASLATDYRLWIYNGQADACLPYNGAEVSRARLG